MKNKKNLVIILCTLLVICVVSGCSDKSVAIKENIIGSWNAGSGYMVFFENGEMALFDESTGKGEMMPYEVEGNTVVLYANATTLKLSSVGVDDDTLTYISEQGHENVWYSVSDEAVLQILNTIELDK